MWDLNGWTLKFASHYCPKCCRWGYTKKFVARNVEEVGRDSTAAILRGTNFGVDTRWNLEIARNIARNIAPCIRTLLYYSFKIFSSLKLVNSTRSHFPLCWMAQPCAQVFLGQWFNNLWRQWFNNLQRAALLTSFWRQWFNHLQRTALLTSLVQYDRILGQQQLLMVNYACGFNQLETGKYLKE